MRKLLALLLFAVSAFAADVTGTWTAEVQTDAGSGTPTFVLKQTSEDLSGTYSGALGEAKLTGTVKGTDITWSFKANANGDDVTVTYKGTLDGNAKMKGTVEIGSLGKGTFTATKRN
jgi:hypothetical protein